MQKHLGIVLIVVALHPPTSGAAVAVAFMKHVSPLQLRLHTFVVPPTEFDIDPRRAMTDAAHTDVVPVYTPCRDIG